MSERAGLVDVPTVAWVARETVRLMPGAWGVLSAPCYAAGRGVEGEQAGSADLRPRAEGVVLGRDAPIVMKPFLWVGGGV
jgi:hypothetical protein